MRRPTSTSTTGRAARYLALLAALVAVAWGLGREGGEILALERWGPAATRTVARARDLVGAGREANGALAPTRPPRPASAATGEAAGAPAIAPAAAGGTPASPSEQTPEERDAADRLAEGMKRLVRDLEYNAGLPEPPQQTVVAPPAPWRPPPAASSAEPPEISELRPNAAPVTGGALVRVRGRNLRPAQVMFGNAPARILSVASDEVAVLAPPAGAGAVTVALTNEDGSYALAREPFTYGK